MTILNLDLFSQDSDLTHFLEDGAKVKKKSKIKPHFTVFLLDRCILLMSVQPAQPFILVFS